VFESHSLNIAFSLQKKKRMKVKGRGKGRMKKMMHNEERVAET